MRSAVFLHYPLAATVTAERGLNILVVRILDAESYVSLVTFVGRMRVLATCLMFLLIHTKRTCKNGKIHVSSNKGNWLARLIPSFRYPSRTFGDVVWETRVPSEAGTERV